MEIFALEYGKWLCASYRVYLVCTGLYDNIEQLSNVNLTFFRRAATIKTGPLNYVRMAEMYRNMLSLDLKDAKRMADLTKGYPYAFQELGVLSFKRKAGDTDDEILLRLKQELFSYAYITLSLPFFGEYIEEYGI